MEEILLDNWAFRVEMGCCKDIFKLHGWPVNHPTIDGECFTSTPISFNEEEMTVVTASGRHYKLGNCDGKLEEQLGHLRECIAKGGYQVL